MTITTGRVPSDTRLTIHYLAHSAWLVETARRFILLDYGVLPARDESAAAKLSQGCLDLVSLWPDWLGATKKPVFVFASHRHRDHYHPGLHQWLANLPGQGHLFVLGIDPADPGPVIPDPPERTLLVRPDEVLDAGDAKLATFASTDQGVALVVQFPELTVYHGGDLACWTDEAIYANRHAQSLNRHPQLPGSQWPAGRRSLLSCLHQRWLAGTSSRQWRPGPAGHLAPEPVFPHAWAYVRTPLRSFCRTLQAATAGVYWADPLCKSTG
ncbi:MAG: MBL fold metallo-hydrolase [Clostridiales bacterium]|nr:MBL fold metallo-hydrolase [Clostridiales bacterium]